MLEKINVNNSAVIFVGGPTATGKTALSIKLAKAYNGAVISADSRQFYIGMDIGTAKVAARENPPNDTSELWKIPIKYEDVDHYLMDIVYPNERYTLFDFKEQAYELISDLQSKGITPIIAGGTGLYIDALINNYQLSVETPEDSEIKKNLEQRLKEEGSETLWNELHEVDPDYAKEIHKNNGYYIVRALEFHKVTGESKSKSGKKTKPPFDPILIGIKHDREDLYRRVEDRIDEQINEGLIEETKSLFEKYDSDEPALTSLGYREIHDYLVGAVDLESALKEFKKNTRHFAKRQITWFKRYEDMIWINPNEI